MPLTTIFTTFSSAEAQLIRSMLEAANLHANVKNELSALSMDGYAMAAGGIQVQVLDEEAELARELIETSVPESPEDAPQAPADAPPRRSPEKPHEP
jgi:hypothetical protein